MFVIEENLLFFSVLNQIIKNQTTKTITFESSSAFVKKGIKKTKKICYTCQKAGIQMPIAHFLKKHFDELHLSFKCSVVEKLFYKIG